MSADERRATEENVARATGVALGREGIGVMVNSPNVLSITLAYPNQAWQSIDRKSCVEMMGDLRLPGEVAVTATALGCAEFKNALGMSYGGHVSTAFQQAAGALLRYLDEGYSAMMSVPVFDAHRIAVPQFASVGVAALQLKVIDDYSSDGTLGKNLLDQLLAAFNEAGVKVEDNADQQLVITLSRPNRDSAGHSRSTCVSISTNARLRKGTAFGHGTACRGTTAAAHHDVLNEALRGLLTEYKRVIDAEPLD